MNSPDIVRILIAALAVYIMFGLYIYYFQNSFIFYPDKADWDTCQTFTNEQKHEYNGTRFILIEKSTEDIIVFYHGNAGSACNRDYILPSLEDTNKSILIVEYAGYSNDKQKPSKELIISDTNNIIKWVNKQKYKNTYIIGESIGGTPASYHAAKANASKLILITPFNKLSEVAQSIYPIYPAKYLIKNNYENDVLLKNYNNPILIIHGNKDRTIPQKHSRKLYDNLNTKDKQYIEIDGAAHNTMFHFKKTEETINNFLK